MQPAPSSDFASPAAPATVVPEQHRVTRSYRPKSRPVFCLQVTFVSANAAVVALIFLAWHSLNSFVIKSTADNAYGASTGLPCASRMLSWMEALFGLSLVSKLGLLFILLTEFLDDHVVRTSNKVFDCMLCAALVFKMMIPFGFGFKLFWHLCGSVVLADARSCHLGWLEAPLPDQPRYADDLMNLKTADAELLSQLQILWLAILLIYLVAVTLFLFGIVICTPSEAVAATLEIQRMANERLELASFDHTNNPPYAPNSIPESVNAAPISSRYPPRRDARYTDVWLSLATSDRGITEGEIRPRRLRQRGLTTQDFEELPNFRFKNLTERKPPVQHRLNTFFHRNHKQPSPADSRAFRADANSQESPSLRSVASAPELRDGTEPSSPTAAVLHHQIGDDLGPFTTEMAVATDGETVIRNCVNTMTFNVTPHHGMPQNVDGAQEQQSQHLEEQPPQEGPQETLQETLQETTQEEGQMVIVVEDDQQQPTGADMSPRFSHRPQSERQERRRRVNGRTTREVLDSYDRAFSVSTSLPPSRRIMSSAPTPSSSTRHLNIEANPNLYNFLLFLVYFLVTLTDIKSPPECCARSPEATTDDYIDTAVINLVLCCRTVGQSQSLGQRIRSCFSSFWNWILCKSSTTEEGSTIRRRKRHLTKKDKELLIQSALDSLSETLTMCCICFVEYHPSDVLVVLPCKYRHYFHRHCAQTWLRQHSTCPLCRGNLQEGLEEIRCGIFPQQIPSKTSPETLQREMPTQQSIEIEPQTY